MAESITPDQKFTEKLTGIILANLENENFSVKEPAHEAGLTHYSLSRKLHAINKKTIN